MKEIAMELGERMTRYHGEKKKVATVFMRGREHVLGLSDTYRIAMDRETEIAERTLRNVEPALARQPEEAVKAAALALRNHCRAVINWKPPEEIKRDVQRQSTRKVDLGALGL